MNYFKKEYEHCEEALQTQGYVNAGRIPLEDLNALRTSTERLKKGINNWDSGGEFFALFNASYELKMRSNQIIREQLHPCLSDIFDQDQVDIYPVSHLIKPFGRKGHFSCHQDSSIVYEPENSAYNIWVPLKNVNRLNGRLWVLPGSHIFPYYDRPFGTHPFKTDKIQKELWEKMIPVDVKAGEILIFNRAVLHGSYQNYLPWPRIVLESVMVNKNAQLIQVHEDRNTPEGKLLLFEVDVAHFLKENPKELFKKRLLKYELLDKPDFGELREALPDYYHKFEEYAQSSVR